VKLLHTLELQIKVVPHLVNQGMHCIDHVGF